MKWLVIYTIAFGVMCSSCGRKMYVASTKDSLSVEIRHKYTERVRDSLIYVPVPYEVEKIVTRDTSSRLENSIAYSEASVSGGFLHHTLENKNVKLPANIQIKEVERVRDSIVYRDKKEVVVQEVNRLTWWQQTKIKGFWVLLAGCLIYIGIKRLPITKIFKTLF